MIVNETVISKADVAFLVNRDMKTPKKKFLKVILLLIALVGFTIFVFGMWFIIRAKKVHMDVSDTYWAIIQWSIYGFLGLLFFFFGEKIAYWRAMHSKAWAAVIGSTVRSVIDGDSVTVSRCAVGTDTQSKYALSLIDSFAVLNDSLYICAKADNQKKYIILQDSGYTEGNRDDVLALLHKYGVPMMQMP